MTLIRVKIYIMKCTIYPCVPLVDLQSSTSCKIFATPKSDSRRYPLACKSMFSGFISDKDEQVVI